MTNRSLIEKLVESPEDAARAPRLTRSDWLEQALQVLISNGVEAVRITRLAELLGVTRGSFYWHFKDRAEILAALLELWEHKNTARIIAAARMPGNLQTRMLALFEVWLDPSEFDPRLDFAVRDWGRGDQELQQQIRDADRRRLQALITMFADHGYNAAQAEARARNVYYIQMGYYALDVQEPMQDRLALLPTYFQTYTDQELAPETVSEFTRRISEKYVEGPH